MNELIACCGLNCVSCDARTATINNNDELRNSTAVKWREMYNAPHINAEMINCTGCRSEGIKFDYCSKCEIRNCVDIKGFDTCGDCNEMSNCEKVASVHKFVPEAIENLKVLQINKEL